MENENSWCRPWEDDFYIRVTPFQGRENAYHSAESKWDVQESMIEILSPVKCEVAIRASYPLQHFQLLFNVEWHAEHFRTIVVYWSSWELRWLWRNGVFMDKIDYSRHVNCPCWMGIDLHKKNAIGALKDPTNIAQRTYVRSPCIGYRLLFQDFAGIDAQPNKHLCKSWAVELDISDDWRAECIGRYDNEADPQLCH